MSVYVAMTNVDKRKNSTKVVRFQSFPAYFPCELKEATSILNPTLILESDDSITKYNYLYIYEFQRYYFIDDIISLNQNLWEISATVDVLATYHDKIQAQSCYVLRASQRYDGYIVDSKYPTSTEYTTHTQSVSASQTMGTSMESGVYCVTTISKQSATPSQNDPTGLITYQLEPNEFRNVMTALMGVADDSSLWGSLADGVVNSLYDPLSYIVSAYWFPNGFPTAKYTNFKCGNWDSGVNCATVDTTRVKYDEFSVGIPKHPQQYARGKYVNVSPYSEYVLDMGVSVYKPDPSVLVDEDVIFIHIYPDAVTGEGKMLVYGSYYYEGLPYADTNRLLTDLTVNYGVAVNISTVKNNMLSNPTGSLSSAVAGGLLGGFASLFSGGSFISAGVQSASNVLTQGTVVGGGGRGTLVAHQVPKKLYATFYQVVDDYQAEYGRPLCKVTTLNSLSGFVQTDGKGITIQGAMASEIDLIESFLVSGVFLE